MAQNDVTAADYLATALTTPTGLAVDNLADLFAERVATVTNHAALAAIVPTSGAPTFYCSGHTSAGDGGEGVWRWEAGASDTANGGTILGSNAAGRWKRAFSGPVNVKWFDSLSDAVTYANAFYASGALCTLFFPAGTYDATGLTLGEGVSLLGEGVESVISGAPTFTNSNNTHQVSVKNLLFDEGVSLSSCHGCLWENVQFADTLTFSNSSLSFYNTFIGCFWRNIDGCIYAKNQNNFNTFIDCRFWQATGSAPAIYLDSDGGATPIGWTMIGCSIEAISSEDGPFGPAMDISGSGHKFINMWIEIGSRSWGDYGVYLRGSNVVFEPAYMHGGTNVAPISVSGGWASDQLVNGGVYDSVADANRYGYKRGSIATPTTDSNGDVTVSGSMIRYAGTIIAQIRDTTPYFVQPHTEGASGGFKLRVFDASGSPVTSTLVPTIYYIIQC